MLEIVSLTTNLTVKSLDLRLLTKKTIDTITVVTHRYVLLTSKKADWIQVLTMEDSRAISLAKFNEGIGKILSDDEEDGELSDISE